MRKVFFYESKEKENLGECRVHTWKTIPEEIGMCNSCAAWFRSVLELECMQELKFIDSQGIADNVKEWGLNASCKLWIDPRTVECDE